MEDGDICKGLGAAITAWVAPRPLLFDLPMYESSSLLHATIKGAVVIYILYFVCVLLPQQQLKPQHDFVVTR